MINNRLAVALCVHHKPWLMMSTLITLALQDFKEFDLYFLYQVGDGVCKSKKAYDEYFRLSERYGANVQLSSFDGRVKDVAHKVKFTNLFEMDFENDQSLDSGAWYKFIRTDVWKKYEYVLFVQEGTLFTRESVISSALDFVRKNNVHFLSAGHEKRKLSKELLLHYNERENPFGELDIFHDRKIQEVFTLFCRDKDFKNVYELWRNDFSVVTQNHVPFYFDSLKEMLIWISKGIMPWKKMIYVKGMLRYLDKTVDRYWENRGVLFHKDNELEWFGCSCQHLFSRRFLEDFSKKLEANSLYEAIDIPFAGTPLEVIWGFLPKWLGYDKWFFDGIHRVRKNFVTYKREDDSLGMCRYLNRYFKGKVYVEPRRDFIKIKKINKRYTYVKEFLTDFFFEG